MSDKLVVDIDSKDAEVAMRNLDRLTAAAEQMGKAFENTKGATSALRELRLMLTGIKGQQSSLDQLTDSIKNMNSSSESLKRSIVGSIKSLGTIIKSEMEQVRAVMFTSGVSTGKALAEGIDDSTSIATGAVKRQGRTLAAAAKAEATRVYESMVSGQANAKIKDVGALFKLEEAGATLSPYHKQVLANWKKSSTETFKALKAQLATEAAQIEAAAKSENAALQARLQEMEAYSKSRSNSLTDIYRRSLARGAGNISQVKAELKAERTALEATVRAEEAALQGALGRMESASKLRSASLSDLYAGSLKRGSQSIARVRAKLKEESLEVLNTVKTEEAALQAALEAMEQNSKVRKSSLTDIYAASLLRGNQSIARVKAQLKEQANQIIQAQETEMARVQRQVSAATNNASGVYQRYNPNNGMAGSIIEPGKTGEITQMSKALKQLTIDGNDAHSMARGLASGFNLLWLTWGNLVPLFAGASVSFGLKKTFDIGSEVEYQIKMMETLGQTTQSQGKVIREALREIDQTTQFSLVELSQAMVRLGQSGKTPKEALEILRPAADLASVGMVDLKTSTDLLIQTQALFGKSTADVGKIAAQVFEITKSGVLNVEDIGASMKYASEANTRFGKSVEETLTILGALAQAGIKGASGGTAYINFLRDLNGRSGPAIAALKELEKATGKTIQVFKETGEQRSAIEIFTDIAAAADKLKAKDADKLLAKIFSDRGGRAFFAMVRDGTIDLEKTVKTLEEVKPENLFLAAKGLMDTTKGALNVLQGALVGALDKVFEANETKFKTFITDITAVISSPEFGAAVHSMVSAVNSLYESIKTLMPVLQTLGTAWVVFKAASVGVSVFQGLAAAIAGMAPVLGMTGTAIMRNTAALATSTQAWGANGVAMIGNVAASRAAAAGIDSVGVAAARSAATAAVAGTGMRALAVVLGFLSNPIVGIITTLGLLGAAFWSAKSDAEAATSGISNAVITNGRINIQQWREEIKVLRDRNALMGQTDAYTPMEGAINEARAKLAKESSDYMRILERYESESKGATARQQEVLDARYGRVLENKLRSIRKEQDIINQAQDAIDAARLRDLSAKEESERQQRARQVKPQGDTEISGGGGRGKFVEQIRVANENELKEIEKRNNAELVLMQNASANAQKVLDARHQAGLLSEGEYQARIFAQVRQSEADQLAMLNKSKEAYTKAMTARATTLGDALQKAMKLGDNTQIEKFTAKLQNLGQTAETFYTGVDSAIAKIADNGMTRLDVASIKAQASIKKLADTEREYWKKDSDETSKIRALQDAEQQYRNINESVFSLDLANKAAALAGAEQTEKLNAHLAELDYGYQMAESAALSFMTSNIMALASGDTEATKLYNNLRDVAEALKTAREAAGVKAGESIRDRSLLAFEKVRREQNAKLASDLSDAVMTGLVDGGEAGKKKLRDMLVAEIRRPIKMVVDLTMKAGVSWLMGGGTSVAAAAGGGSGGGVGGGGIISSIQTGISALNGTISNTISSAFSKFAGSGVGQSLGLSNTTYAAGPMGPVAPGMELTATGQSLGSALGFVGNTLAGYALGSMAKSLISGGYSVSKGMNTFQNVGIAVGSALGGPIGGALIGAASGVINRLFGRKLKDSGIQGTFGGQTGFEGESFQFYKGGLFRSNKTKTSALDEEIRKTLGDTFNAMRVEVGTFATLLGLETERLAGFTTNMKISTQGLDAEAAQAKIQEALATANNELAQQVLGSWQRTVETVTRTFTTGDNTEAGNGLQEVTYQEQVSSITYTASDFARTGEQAIDTLKRLATSLATVNGTFENLGWNLKEASLKGADAASKFADLFGGLEGFAQAAGVYYDNFYSEAEKTANVTRDITAALADVGLQMPATRQEFRALVESQLALGEGGTKAVAALLGVSGAFASVVPAAEALGNVLSETMKRLQSDTAGLQIELLRAQGNIPGADAAQRAIDTAGFTEAEVALYDYNTALRAQIASLNDAAAAAQEQAQIRAGFERQLLELQGDTAALRLLDIAGMDEYNVSLYDQVQSLTAAASAAQTLADNARNLRTSLISVEGRFSGGGFSRQYMASDAATEISSLLASVGINKDTGAITSALLNSTTDEVESYFREIWEVLDTDEARLRLVEVANTMLDLATVSDTVAEKFQKQTEGLSKLATDVASLFAARNSAGNLRDKIAGAMGNQGSFAAQREGELWSALYNTKDLKKQVDLAEQLTDIVISRQKTEVQNAEKLMEFGKGLKSYVDSLKLGAVSPLTNAQKLTEASKQYSETLSKAMSGDTNAQANLQNISSSFLEIARTYYAGNDDFVSIFNSVTSSLESLGINSMSESQQQLAVGNQSLAELQKLYTITESAYSSLNSQYESALSSLALAQDSLVLQAKSFDQLVSISGILSSLPGEISARLPDLDISLPNLVTSTQNGDTVDNTALIEEVKALRLEIARLAAENREDAAKVAAATIMASQANAATITDATTKAARTAEVKQGATIQ